MNEHYQWVIDDLTARRDRIDKIIAQMRELLAAFPPDRAKPPVPQPAPKPHKPAKREGRRPRLTEAEGFRILEMRAAGKPVTAIAAELGRSKSAIFKFIKESGD